MTTAEEQVRLDESWSIGEMMYRLTQDGEYKIKGPHEVRLIEVAKCSRLRLVEETFTDWNNGGKKKFWVVYA